MGSMKLSSEHDDTASKEINGSNSGRSNSGGGLGKNLALMVIAILVMLILSEGILWLLDFKPYYCGDPELDNPSFARYWIADEKGNRFNRDYLNGFGGRLRDVNSQGFSDKDEFVRSDKLKGAYKILVLGDSFTWGASATYGNSYVEKLEKSLKESRHVELWNLAIPATATRQALSSLKEFGPIMQPDLVILGFCMNDFPDNYIRRMLFLGERISPRFCSTNWMITSTP